MEISVPGFRWLTSLAIGLTFSASAFAAQFDVAAARKTCLDNYNLEKEAGTVPAGMPKSKYLSQCTNSMRRNFELDQKLATQQAGGSATATQAAGSNEITASKPGKPGAAQPSTSKPATVTTPAFAPHGQ